MSDSLIIPSSSTGEGFGRELSRTVRVGVKNKGVIGKPSVKVFGLGCQTKVKSIGLDTWQNMT